MTFIPYDNRQDFLSKYPIDHRTYDTPPKGRINIYRPLMSSLKVGMMVRAWKFKSPTSTYSYGYQIVELDNKKERVKIKIYVGGTMEKDIWKPLSDIIVVW